MPKEKKQKMIEVTVIYTLIIQKKNYIRHLSQSMHPGKTLPDYTTDITLAKPFVDEKDAQDAIQKIHNVHDRIFNTEKVMLPADSLKPAAFSEQALKALI